MIWPSWFRLTRSRTEPASRVERARMLLAYRQETRPSLRSVTAWGSIIRRSSAALKRAGVWSDGGARIAAARISDGNQTIELHHVDSAQNAEPLLPPSNLSGFHWLSEPPLIRVARHGGLATPPDESMY